MPANASSRTSCGSSSHEGRAGGDTVSGTVMTRGLPAASSRMTLSSCSGSTPRQARRRGTASLQVLAQAAAVLALERSGARPPPAQAVHACPAKGELTVHAPRGLALDLVDAAGSAPAAATARPAMLRISSRALRTRWSSSVSCSLGRRRRYVSVAKSRLLNSFSAADSPVYVDRLAMTMGTRSRSGCGPCREGRRPCT